MSLTRAAKVVSPLGPEALLFLSMSAREALGRPFAYEVDVLSDDPRLELAALLGQSISVELELSEGTVREFSGHVTQFSLVGEFGRYVRYRATLRPWLWLLGHTANCRIFQNQSVPEVVKQLFREHGFSDFAESLSAEYRTWEYLVQYRESDLNFISRLLEQEGIYYFFKHRAGKHTLVLADSYSSHEVLPGYEEIPYFPPQERERRERDHIDGWQVSRQIRPGAVSLVDYDFERPKAKLAATLRLPNEHTRADFEVYDYPAAVRQTQEAEQQARLRLEERQADYEVAQGSGNARGILLGGLFLLSDFPREDQNKEYLVIEAHHELRVDGYESGSSEPEEPDYRCQFTAIESKHPFRAARLTPKPTVEGPQTAVVVGQESQEIWTDQYGRVKVQFHWDREGAFDENSSCWVRVSQVWAGTGWGALHIPRIGQEVIVDFLEGDPDRPIITGRVYNADNMPPYELPANQTQSGIKSRSSKGATPDNFNELRFEDKKGQEDVYLQAERNRTTLVKNDQSTTVKKNRSASVGANDSVSVGGDRSLSVQGNLSVTVAGGGKSPIHSTTSVTGKHSLHASDTIDVDAPTHIKFECGGSSILIEPGKITITAGGKAMVVLDANVLVASSAGTQLVMDANAHTKAKSGAEILLDANVLAQSKAQSKILLDSNALMQSNADVILDGMKVAATGKTEASLTVAASSVKLTPASTDVAAAAINVNGTGMVSIAAPMIKVG